jgi:hypothetical protein
MGYNMTTSDFVPKESIVSLKKAEEKLVRLLNDRRTRFLQKPLTEILHALRDVGSHLKEEEEFDPKSCIHYYDKEKICWSETYGKPCNEECKHFKNILKGGIESD